MVTVGADRLLLMPIAPLLSSLADWPVKWVMGSSAPAELLSAVDLDSEHLEPAARSPLTIPVAYRWALPLLQTEATGAAPVEPSCSMGEPEQLPTVHLGLFLPMLVPVQAGPSPLLA